MESVTKSNFRIAVLPGDGIGKEVVAASLHLLEALRSKVPGIRLALVPLEAGAALYRRTGTALSEETLATIDGCDAILLGAMGLPDVRLPDGRELVPQIDLRFHFELYAGIRPIRAIPGAPTPLADPRAKEIDFVIIRESTEGLFADLDGGKVTDDKQAQDTLIITREVSTKLFKTSFDLTAQRKLRGLPGRLVCIDKANVLTSMAFFRRIFDECARDYPDIDAGHEYVDAAALNFVRRPWEYDVVVTENMYGDILSDLAAGLIGGMGMAPSADLGDRMAVFQPCHGSAPDITGQGKANPVATFLSMAMMLDWLGQRDGMPAYADGAMAIQDAIDDAFRNGALRPVEMGGSDGTRAITDAVIRALRERHGATTKV